MDKSVVILGAAGRFGRAATAAFAAAGWQVFAQVRPGRDLAGLPTMPGVTWLRIAIDHTDALAQATPGASIVVHALNPGYCNIGWQHHGGEYMQAAIALARRHGARVMFPGNVYNFGAQMPELLRANTPQQATDTKGKVRVAVEARLQAAVGSGGLRGVVIRAGDFFGSGRGSWFDELIGAQIWRGRVTYPGALDIEHAWAYVPDLARTFVRVAERDATMADWAVLGFGGHAVTGQQWVDQFTRVTRRLGWLAEGKAIQVRALPWLMMRLAGLVSPRMQAVADMRHLWQRPHRIDNRELVALIGDEPHTPFATAAAQATAALYPHALDDHDPLDRHMSPGTTA